MATMQNCSMPWHGSKQLLLGAAVGSVWDHTVPPHLAAAPAAGRQLANREERPYPGSPEAVGNSREPAPLHLPAASTLSFPRPRIASAGAVVGRREGELRRHLAASCLVCGAAGTGRGWAAAGHGEARPRSAVLCPPLVAGEPRPAGCGAAAAGAGLGSGCGASRARAAAGAGHGCRGVQAGLGGGTGQDGTGRDGTGQDSSWARAGACASAAGGPPARPLPQPVLCPSRPAARAVCRGSGVLPALSWLLAPPAGSLLQRAGPGD